MRSGSVSQADLQQACHDPEDSSRGAGISDSSRTTFDLGTAFSQIKQEISGESPVKFRIVMEGQCRPLHSLVYEHAYRIGREALLNAFRHSQASRIDLNLSDTPTGLCLTISDNGKGISPDVVHTGCAGLSQMKGLADRIGARLKLLSRVRAGTEVLVAIPSQVAFAGKANSRLGFAGARSLMLGF